MSQKYDEYLEKHRQAVKKAYQWIAAYIPELTDVEATRNIEFHDMSKNTPDEYTPYDNYFYGEQTPAIIEAFNRAWLMHIHRNPHHWQYWVLINDEPKEGTILIEMPYPYIIEMICDWWAFSWIKGDLSEMFAWYKDHAEDGSTPFVVCGTPKTRGRKAIAGFVPRMVQLIAQIVYTLIATLTMLRLAQNTFSGSMI